MSDYFYEEEPQEELSLRDAIQILKGSAGDYFAARKELLQIESKEASEFLMKKIAIVIALTVVGLFTYFLFWLAVITAGAKILKDAVGNEKVITVTGTWPIVGAVVVVLHICALFILVKKLKKKADFELFQMTKSELNRDKQWLEENK